jgi:hypothetical protein
MCSAALPYMAACRPRAVDDATDTRDGSKLTPDRDGARKANRSERSGASISIAGGVVDLTKGGFGFGGSDGIGATWKMRSSRSNEKGARRAAPRVCFRCPRSE